MNTSTFGKMLISASLLAITSCGGSSGGSGDNSAAATQTEQKAILVQATDSVIVPTYQDLAAKSAAMKAATLTYIGAQTAQNLDAARAAWIATRVPWERSESFLIGPVHEFGYDPQMDDWPLDHAQLTAAMTNAQSESGDQLTTGIASGDTNLKGFHAIEFILWGFNKSKTDPALTASEATYLPALLSDHVRITSLLSAAWSTDATPYGNYLKTAGDAGNDKYPTTQSGIDELLTAMADIANEVGSSKIAGPYKDQDSNEVESQFSYNSLNDFTNNVYSIRNIYFGTLDGTVAAASLSTYVKSRDATMDATVVAKINASVAAIAAIPEPFRDSIKSEGAKPQIEAAITTLADLQSYIVNTVHPFILP